MAFLIKNIDSLTDEMKHLLSDSGATITELDLDFAVIAQTSLSGEWDHLYYPKEGRLNEANKIVTGEYVDILKGLRNNYKEYIGHIIIDRLMMIEDTEWEYKETSTDNSIWKIQLSKASKMVQEICGIDYIIKLRTHWLKDMDRAQKAAMIFAELIRIDKENGAIVKLTSLSVNPITSTFGANWLDKDVKLPDISKEKIQFLAMKKANGQITFAEIEGEVKDVEVGKQNDETPFDEEPEDHDEMQEIEE